MNRPKILIVEDDAFTIDYLELALRPYLLIVAKTVKRAYEDFAANPDLAAIVMDGKVPGGSGLAVDNTLRLTADIRQDGYAGPIIATSSSLELRRMQLEAGCDLECHKDQLVRLLPKLAATQLDQTP